MPKCDVRVHRPRAVAKVRKEKANPTARLCPNRQGVRSLGKEPRIF
jgi:hypothetical protein